MAVSFAAADTYVIVLALPEMMASAGLSAEELQRAAPIISGFLLGYVAMLPMVGRIADVRGRVPVLTGSLVIFSLGSLVTAAAYDLPSMVVGRMLQGVGAGGLLPATLALVADFYPPGRRGMPLGVVGAVQEFGNVLGPVYGAGVLVFGSWRDIFLLNLAGGLLLTVLIRRAAPAGQAGPRWRERDWIGALLTAGGITAVTLVMLRPDRLVHDVTAGLAFVSLAGGNRWLTPVALVAYVLLLLFGLRCATARAPLLDLLAWGRLLGQVDVVGAVLLGLSLAGVVLAFSTADPQTQVVATNGPSLLAGSAAAAVAFWYRSRTAERPLVPLRTLAATPAWGAMVVSFFVGAAVIAALVDIPIFARVTVYGDSQLLAAMVLVRFLLGLPVGAFVGGWLTRRVSAGAVTALGMVISLVGFASMAQWGLESLRSPWATLPLVLAGLGIGLAMAPVNAALLSATSDAVHGVSSALLVVSRTVGKLVGISVLTTVGLRRFYAQQGDLPAPKDICPGGGRAARSTA